MGNQTDFEKLGAAIRALIQGFHQKNIQEDLHSAVLQEMGYILQLAERIGDPLYSKAKELKIGFNRSIRHPEKKEFAEQFVKQALLLEQETREI